LTQEASDEAEYSDLHVWYHAFMDTLTDDVFIQVVRFFRLSPPGGLRARRTPSIHPVHRGIPKMIVPCVLCCLQEKIQKEIDLRHTQRLRLAGIPAPCIITLGLALSWMQLFPQDDRSVTALTFEQQGKTAEAEEAWKASSRAHPNDPVPFAHIGLLEARQEHYPQSIVYYRKAMALNPSLPGLHLNLGLAQFKDGQYREAIQSFTPLLKAQPASSTEGQRLTILMGMSYYGLGAYSASTPYLKQASDSDSKNLPLLLTLAHSCLLSKQYQCVLDTYHRMIELNADSAEADILVGEAMDEMKDTDGAIREFRAAVSANPKEPNVHFGLGYLLWEQGHTPEAAEQFQAELNNEPGHMQAMVYLGDAYVQMNKIQDAQTLLETVVKDNPSNVMGHLDLGIVYEESGSPQQAVVQFKRAIALKPDEPKAHYRLGRLLRSMGRTAEANAEFAKTKELNEHADEGLLKAMSKVPNPPRQHTAKPMAPAQK
jgi:tetratricopeptide (TPR) repeat protein